MSGFSAEWLTLREPADHAARADELTRLAARAVAGGTGGRALAALDLGSGTGSNIRYLAPRLGVPQAWRAVDADQRLLTEVPGRTLASLPAGSRIDLQTLDLRDLGGSDLLAAPQLVTASALLDLVSAEWVADLASRCRAPVALFVLTYDGRLACDPVDERDEEVRALVNRHQRTDKGFGPALGPEAAACAAAEFGRAGYTVRLVPSDWRLGPGQHDLQGALIDGWAGAAAEMAPDAAEAVEAWRQRRLRHVAAGVSRLRVGHQDLLALR